MFRLRSKTNMALAMTLAVTLLVGVAGGALATGYLKSGRALKAVKVVVAAQNVRNGVGAFADIPDFALTMNVPSGEQALFLITFSATILCGAPDSGRCTFRAVVDGKAVSPAPLADLTAGAGEIGFKMQWPAGPIGSGQHTVKIQYGTNAQSTNIFVTSGTLSVIRSKM